jgi:hypothetical protein
MYIVVSGCLEHEMRTKCILALYDTALPDVDHLFLISSASILVEYSDSETICTCKQCIGRLRSLHHVDALGFWRSCMDHSAVYLTSFLPWQPNQPRGCPRVRTYKDVLNSDLSCRHRCGCSYCTRIVRDDVISHPHVVRLNRESRKILINLAEFQARLSSRCWETDNLDLELSCNSFRQQKHRKLWGWSCWLV